LTSDATRTTRIVIKGTNSTTRNTSETLFRFPWMLEKSRKLKLCVCLMHLVTGRS